MPGHQIDWDAIEREYRTGQLSIREIGRQYGVSHVSIHRHAKADGWERDLSRKVRQIVKSRLVTTGAESTSVPSTDGTKRNARAEEKAIVEAAAKRTLAIIETHRNDAQQQKGIVKRLQSIVSERLKTAEASGAVVTVEELKAISVIQRNSSQALDKLVGIERRAFSMDESSGDEGAPDAISLTYYRKRSTT